HQEVMCRAIVGRGEELSRVAERLVEVAVGNPGLPADVLHPGGDEPAGAVELERGIEQEFASLGDALSGADAAVAAAGQVGFCAAHRRMLTILIVRCHSDDSHRQFWEEPCRRAASAGSRAERFCRVPRQRPLPTAPSPPPVWPPGDASLRPSARLRWRYSAEGSAR